MTQTPDHTLEPTSTPGEGTSQGVCTLTDAEREAVAWFANYGYSPDGVPGRMASTLRGLLERMG